MTAPGVPLSATTEPAAPTRTAASSVAARALAGLFAGAVVLSFIALRPIRVAEAMLSARLLDLLGTGADRFGTAVLVDADGSRAGFTVANGCSTALLAAPFLVIGALALATGRVRPGRTVLCVVGALAAVVLVNQLRFGIVGSAIHLFGFEKGYGQSHVLIGTLVSTLGLVVGLATFVLAMGRDGRARDAEEADRC